MKYAVLFVLCLLSIETTSSIWVQPKTSFNYSSCSDVIDGTYNKEAYKEVMANLESRNNYHIKNRLGYMGKYQFGKRTLKYLRKKGLIQFNNKDIKWKNFRNNYKLQEEAMEALTTDNFSYLHRNGLLMYAGKDIGGVKVTVSGMLAASHLRGSYAVRQYLESNGEINKKDANGTSVRDYIGKFE